MPNTHCLPTGSLGTAELPVPNLTASTIYTIPATTGAGNRRGVVVSIHGLQGHPTVPEIPSGEYLTFLNDLAADGWTILNPPLAEDFYPGLGYVGVYNDINNDGTVGARYLNQMLRWWDHMVLYTNANYPGWPVVAFGGSWGGWHTIQLAANRAYTILAYGSVFPVAQLENLNPLISPGTDYGLLNTSGFDLTASMLNSTILPGVIGYGTGDNIVGYSGTTTVDTGSNGVAASAVTTLNIVSNTGLLVGPRVTVTGLTGGTGRATFAFTGIGAGTLTGVTLVSGSGTLSTGNPVTQSVTAAVIAAQQAAQPSHQVTAHVTADNHLSPFDTTFYSGWFTSTVDPLAPKIF
jgi:hypothetical protein